MAPRNESPAKESIGERIARLRTDKGVTQQEMAAALYVDRVTVSQWEKGTRDIKTRNMVSLAEYLGVSCDYLLGRSRISAPDDFIQAACKRLGLQESVIQTLELYGKAAANNAALSDFVEHSIERRAGGDPLPQTSTELELKALNHIIANCNALLTVIGLYLFGNFTGLENVKVEGIDINLDKPGGFIRNGMLSTITSTLFNYRTLLVENGGDLPLNKVLEQAKKDEREQFAKQRIGFLESVKGRPLTEAEIQQQRDLYDYLHTNTNDPAFGGRHEPYPATSAGGLLPLRADRRSAAALRMENTPP